MIININKTKAIVVSHDGKVINIQMSRRTLKQVESIKYLGTIIAKAGICYKTYREISIKMAGTLEETRRKPAS